MSISVDSLPITRPLVVGANSEGYYRKKLLFPNTAYSGADSVTSLNLTSNGSGYSTAPNVVFTPSGSGSGAAATAVLGFGIDLVNVTAAGSYAALPTIGATVGTGATFVPHMEAVNISLSNPGTGYAVDDVITVDGGAFGTSIQLLVTAIGAGGAISTFTVSSFGDYTALPASPASSTGSGIGSGATFNILWGLLSIAVTAAGQDYDATSQITVTGTGAGGGAATPVLAATGRVKALDLISGGSEYDVAPAVSFTGGGGTGAAATASLGAGDGVTVSLAFDNALDTANYTVKACGNNACVISDANKTVNGVDINIAPLDGEVLTAGAADIVVHYTA